MLKVGNKAPEFNLESDTGERISLKDLKGKTVVLYFYPKDDTSGCTQEACDFRDAVGKFKKKNAIILGVSKDPIKSHLKFKEKYALPFPLLADEDMRINQAYGVWKEKSLYGRKYMGTELTTVIIGPDGKVKKIYSKVKVAGHVEQILKDWD